MSTTYYPAQPRLPMENLEQYLLGSDELIKQFENTEGTHLVCNTAIALRCGISRQTVIRWRAEGIPLFTADRVAIQLNVHPLNIWPTFHQQEYSCLT